MQPSKRVGFGIMLVALALFALGAVYVRQSEQFLLSQTKTGPNGECIHTGSVCPYEQVNELATPKHIGLIALLLLFGYGGYLFTKKTPQEVVVNKARSMAKDLGKEETTVFDLLVQSGGMMFQNELVQKTGLSKVKTTRLLDKLELKELVERRRRGMTNMIILKK